MSEDYIIPAMSMMSGAGDQETDSREIYLVPSLMTDTDNSSEQQRYPKAGCIVLEKRITLTKHFIPPNLIPKILAKCRQTRLKFLNSKYFFDDVDLSVVVGSYESLSLRSPT